MKEEHEKTREAMLAAFFGTALIIVACTFAVLHVMAANDRNILDAIEELKQEQK